MKPLALPAPARFKVSKSYRLPDVQYWTRELDRLREHAKHPYSWDDPRDIQRRIKDAMEQLDMAEFAAHYAATHDCTPHLSDKRSTAWGERSAKVQIEDSTYRVSVSMGRSARGMYGTRGHVWHLYVSRQGANRKLAEGDRVAKSEGLGGAALRHHLAWKYRVTRGIRSKLDT
jgi:hypothetical protein